MSRLTIEQSLQLDSIRALSAFVVLFGHTYQALLLPKVDSCFTLVVLLSQFAVMVFFVLSGFLIGNSCYNNFLRNSRFNLGEYVLDRALRLYPPLIFTVFLMILLGAIAPYFFPSGTNYLLTIENVRFVHTEFLISLTDIWGTLTFLSGFIVAIPLSNSPLWSLSFEFWYYIIAAASFLWIDRKFFSVCLLVVVFYVTHKNQIFYMLAPVWLSGFGLARIHQHHINIKNKVFFCFFYLLSIIFACSILFSLFENPLGNEVNYDKINIFRLVSGLWFACFLALLLGGEFSFPNFFHVHARYSYTLYVIHFPIILFMLGVFQNYIYSSLGWSLIVSGFAVLISIMISCLLCRWVENKRAIDLLKRKIMDFNQV